MQFTVLSHSSRLVKRFTNGEVTPYPNAKRVTSHTYEVENLEQKAALLAEHAAKGHALLKGNVIRPLQAESRSGLTNKEAHTPTIILDFDGIQIPDTLVPRPLTRDDLQGLAERIIEHLPATYHDADYILHASASMGRKGNRISLHLEFLLDAPLHPRTLKNYLINLNLETELLDNQISLTASGSALKWPLDISLADNTRIIYLAAPLFEGEENPIPDDNDRLFFVDKRARYVSVYDTAMALDPKEIQKGIKRKTTALRRLLGLPEVKHRTQMVRIDGQMVTVVTNPDACNMVFHREGDDFVYYNINGGDSNAYYVRKFSPQIVHNFKGEPKFLFEKADPETYRWHLETFKPSLQDGGAPLVPIVFRDFETDTHYNGLFNPNTGLMEAIAAAQKGNLAAFMAQHGGVMPEMDEIPTWNYVFDPHDPRTVDLQAGFINKYEESPIIRNLIEPPEGLQGANVRHVKELATYCPTIFRILDSICASDMDVMRHFLNWLAFITQNKTKTGTAWVFQGVEGTGKGVFANMVMRPILAKDSLIEIQTNALDENFNGWRERSLLVCVDEFKIKDSAQGQRLFNKLKNMITEPRGIVRQMRENPREVAFHDNYIFFSNDHDIMQISDTDRRFNVAPRQETPLIRRYPGIRQDIHNLLPAELPLFAAYLMHFEMDEYLVKNPLDNLAKEELAEAGRTSVDEFCRALRSGEMDYFLQVFEYRVPLTGSDWVSPAQNVVRSWINSYDPSKETEITSMDLLSIYNVLIGHCDNTVKLGKNMARHGLRTTKNGSGKLTRRVYTVNFRLLDNHIDAVRAQFVPTYMMQNTPAAELPTH